MFSALFTGAIILGAIFIFVILFIVSHKKGNNKKQARQEAVLADIIWKNKLEISEKETIDDYLLAIDDTNFVLLHINLSEPKEVVSIIDLWNIKTVKISVEKTSIYMQRTWKPVLPDKQVKQIQLDVTFADSGQNAHLVLYQYKHGMQDLVQLKRRAEYWCHLINLAIQELPHPSRQTVYV